MSDKVKGFVYLETPPRRETAKMLYSHKAPLTIF